TAEAGRRVRALRRARARRQRAAVAAAVDRFGGLDLAFLTRASPEAAASATTSTPSPTAAP
ncbi:hypothetical protein, partial [Actinomadura sp. CNU-125]|uniref:hypothetical protein n=1 Tax=Actinomadura sp. CNU-125 TaxID=1904961 RepID=UPI0021CCBF82